MSFDIGVAQPASSATMLAFCQSAQSLLTEHHDKNTAILSCVYFGCASFDNLRGFLSLAERERIF